MLQWLNDSEIWQTSRQPDFQAYALYTFITDLTANGLNIDVTFPYAQTLG